MLATSTGDTSPGPETVTPYSVSVPRIFFRGTGPCYAGARTAPTGLQVLAGRDRFDGTVLPSFAHQRADVDDPLALLARDPGPVIRVRRVREVLVLLVLRVDAVEDVLRLDPALPTIEEPLDRGLLRALDDRVDHRAGREVLEVHDLFVAGRIRHLEE